MVHRVNRHLFKENSTGLHLQRIKEMTVSSDHSTPGMKKKRQTLKRLMFFRCYTYNILLLYYVFHNTHKFELFFKGDL